MKKKYVLLVAALACAQLLPITANAYEVLGDKLEIYGNLRMSLDYVHPDAPNADSDIGVSSNRTNFGFRGKLKINDSYSALYQIGQRVTLDESGGEFATTDSYLGVDTPVGQFLFGFINTPFKDMALDFSYYTTSVGDPHVILGAASTDSRPRLDLRTSNSIRWNGQVGDILQFAIQYSAGQVQEPSGADDNDADVLSGSLYWSPTDDLRLGAAYVDYSSYFGTGFEIEGVRFGVDYTLGRFRFKALVEDLDSEQVAAIDRVAYSFGVNYKLTARTLIGTQWVHANESDLGNDEANEFSLGVLHYFNPQLYIYAIASTTRNDESASYRLTGYGHGDNILTGPGGDPFAFSVGAGFSF